MGGGVIGCNSLPISPSPMPHAQITISDTGKGIHTDLLSDIGMPQADGYMLMQQVRKLPPDKGGQIPAIALTAYAGEIDYQQSILVGFQRHIPKPVDPTNLVKTIADLVRHRHSTV
nr:response regulator [Nostoc sp. CreGUA01]